MNILVLIVATAFHWVLEMVHPVLVIVHRMVRLDVVRQVLVESVDSGLDQGALVMPARLVQ